MKNYKVFNIDKNNEVCNSCALKKFNSLYYEIKGDNPELLILGINPGKNEILRNRPFIGRSGKLLRENIDKYVDNYIISNVILCSTPNTNVPEFNDSYIKHCNFWTYLYLDYNIKTIIALGKVTIDAIKYYFSEFDIPEKLSYTQLNTFKTKDTILYTLPHPSYILRTGQQQYFTKLVESIFTV